MPFAILLSRTRVQREPHAWGFYLAYDAQVRSKEFAHAVTGGATFGW
ncbi:MAG: hypothetical protein KA801_10485 [Syntrophorhabdaceae bacterium]|nr:hypothetical protein [Syntrophorhabdaceae bacterium]